MKINNVNTNTLYVSKYKNKEDIGTKVNPNKVQGTKGDKCELSSVGKALNNLSIEEERFGVSKERVEKIKEELNKGIYKVDSEVLAKAILSSMRGEI